MRPATRLPEDGFPAVKQKKFFSPLGCGCAALMLAAVVLIALPGVRWPKRPAMLRGEVLQNLRALHTSQRAHFAELDRYARSFEELEAFGHRWDPERERSSFSYLMSGGGPARMAGKNPPARFAETVCPAPVDAGSDYTVVAAGRADDSGPWQCWSISSADRRIGPADVRAGEPHQHLP